MGTVSSKHAVIPIQVYIVMTRVDTKPRNDKRIIMLDIMYLLISSVVHIRA